jgi:hypothetical protein
MTLWVFNIFLWMMGWSNPGIQASMIENGVTFYNCMEITPQGYVLSNACTDAPPADPQ